jgi:hypothetical protein
VQLEQLTVLDGKLCVKILRATLMTLFAMTNARYVFSYSSVAGYHSSYPSYVGQWGIYWPNGKPCIFLSQRMTAIAQEPMSILRTFLYE